MAQSLVTTLFLFVLISGISSFDSLSYNTIRHQENNVVFYDTFVTNSLGISKVIDFNTRALAYKDQVLKRCYIERLQGQQLNEIRHLRIYRKPLTREEILRIGGPTIASACFGWLTRVLLEPNNYNLRRRRSNYLNGRIRGQTQSQYLSYGKGNHDQSGKAEAEATAEGSKAVVVGSNGMGQAQSQSSPFSCLDCISSRDISDGETQFNGTGAGQFMDSQGRHQGYRQQPGTISDVRPGQITEYQRPRVQSGQVDTGHQPDQPGTAGEGPQFGQVFRPEQITPDQRRPTTSPGQVGTLQLQYPGQTISSQHLGHGQPEQTGSIQYRGYEGQQPGLLVRPGQILDQRGSLVYPSPAETLQYPKQTTTSVQQPGQQLPGTIQYPGTPTVQYTGQITLPAQPGEQGGLQYQPGQTPKYHGPSLHPGQAGIVQYPSQTTTSSQQPGLGQPGTITYQQPGEHMLGLQYRPGQIGSIAEGLQFGQTLDEKRPTTYPGQTGTIQYPGSSDRQQPGLPIHPGPSVHPSQFGTVQYPGQSIIFSQQPGEVSSKFPSTATQTTYSGQPSEIQHGEVYQGTTDTKIPKPGSSTWQVVQPSIQRGPLGFDGRSLYEASQQGTKYPEESSILKPGGSGKFTGKVDGKYQSNVGQGGQFSGSFQGQYYPHDRDQAGRKVTDGTHEASTITQYPAEGAYRPSAQVPTWISTEGQEIGGPSGQQMFRPGQTLTGSTGQLVYGPASPILSTSGQPLTVGGLIPGREEPSGLAPGGVLSGSDGKIFSHGEGGYQPGPLVGSSGKIPGQVVGIEGQIPGQLIRPGQIPGQFVGTVGQIPGQLVGTGGQIPGQVSTGGLIPGQLVGPGGQLLGQFVGTGGQIPSQIVGIGGHMPGQVDTGKLTPGQLVGPERHMPGKIPGQHVGIGGQIPGQVSTGRLIPGQLVGPVGQIPGQFVGTGEQIPGPHVGIGGQIPGQISTGRLIPGQLVGLGGQIPGQFVGTGEQIPGQHMGISGQVPGQISTGRLIPSQLVGLGGQIPGQFVEIGEQIPGQHVGIGGQIPGQVGTGELRPGHLVGAGRQIPGQFVDTGGQIAGEVSTDRLTVSQLEGSGGQIPGQFVGTGGQISGQIMGTRGEIPTQVGTGRLTTGQLISPEGQVISDPGGRITSQQGPGRLLEDSDTQAQSSIQQISNGTQASASSQGRYQGGTAHSQVSGTYSRQGSFAASAGTNDGFRGAQTQVSGSGDGVLSSAQGLGGKGQSQAQVQLNSDTGETASGAQSGGINHGTATQVQAGIKGGMSDAQANGPGSTSSQAQIAFSPNTDEAEQTEQGGHFGGGGTASASGGANSGRSQAQINGKYDYGIKYIGSAQAQSSNDGITSGNYTIPKLKPITFNLDNKKSQESIKPVKVTNVREVPKQDEMQIIPIISSTTQPPTMEDDYDDDYEEDENYDDSVHVSKIEKRTRNLVEQQQNQHFLDPVRQSEDNIPISSTSLKYGNLYQPGEEVPGSQGYKIPTGFRGRITNEGANSKKVLYAVGANANRRSEAFGYGSGYLYQPVYSGLKQGKPYPKFHSVTKSESGSRNIYTGRKIPSVYYTQSSSCGYFTNTCFYNNGKKICVPRPKTNPDGSPIIC